jgi:Mrp family chromosome partitioning ATPase
MESLRNQVLQDIDLRNLTHTPRLVGVTGCETGAGVSTVAAGLAASLSKAGEGNVLLVDMTSRGPVPRAASEQSACELSHALEPGHRTEAQIAEKLYLVSGTAGGESQILPRRFANLVPRFRGSDYDYIVFDLPPVTQLTATAQFCRYMDTMVLVVEAEKTNREVVRQVTATLQDSCESVGVILNKTRSHVPLRAALEV